MLLMYAVFSLDTMGDDDTESMLMVEVAEEPEPIPGPQGQEIGAPHTPPKKVPPAFTYGMKKKKQPSNKAPLSNRPQDLQVCVCVGMGHGYLNTHSHKCRNHHWNGHAII